jgi:hypothetical protein
MHSVFLVKSGVTVLLSLSVVNEGARGGISTIVIILKHARGPPPRRDRAILKRIQQ